MSTQGDATLALAVQVSGTPQLYEAAQRMQQLAAQAAVAQRAFNDNTRGSTNAAKAAAQMGNRMQNASYQVADFVTQVNGGVSASRALAQQLPQLLGGLGMLGAAAGAAVAILLPMATALSDTLNLTKRLETDTKGLADAQKEASTSLADLNEKFGSNAQVMRDINEARERYARLKLAATVREDAAAFADFNMGLADGVSAWTLIYNQAANADFSRSAIGQLFTQTTEVNKQLDFLRDNFSMTAKEAAAATKPMQDFNNAAAYLNTDAAALALKQLNAEIDRGNISYAVGIELLDRMQKRYDALALINPPGKDAMGFAFTPITGATGFNNAAGNENVAQQLKAIEDAQRQVQDQSRKSASEFQSFANTIERGVTPMQQLENQLRKATADFDRFNAQMSPEQRSQAQAYLGDLQKKINDLQFKEKFDEMKTAIDTANASVSPLITSLTEIQNAVASSLASGLADAFVNFATGAESAKQAFASFAADFLRKISEMLIQALALYAIQSVLFGAAGPVAGQGSGGLFGMLGSAFGRSGIGPREGSGTATPAAFGATSGGMSMQAGRILPSTAAMSGSNRAAVNMPITINNQVSGSEVKTKRGADGGLEIEFIRQVVASDIARGGSKIASSIQSGYGLRRSGK